MAASPIYGGIEAGGTKWVIGLGIGDGTLLDRATVPTTTPEETVSRAYEFFASRNKPRGIGIGTFGPVDLARDSRSFGRITTTPKPGWHGTDVVTPFASGLQVPVVLDTDVNVAALGEWAWGNGRGCQTLSYVTVGTGIGGGLLVDGRSRGTSHPELGHIRIPRDGRCDSFTGSCPFHGDCFEGLASGEALRQRWGRRAESIFDPGAWDLEAHYIALGMINVIYALAPDRVIAGGGVLTKPGLLDSVRAKTIELLADYGMPVVAASDTYIRPPALGTNAGVIGAIELARRRDAPI